jgi:hypothetical protein
MKMTRALAPLLLLLAVPAFAETEKPAEGASEATQESTFDKVKKYLGFTYFTFFDGPGVGMELGKTPNSQGLPMDTGWSFWTNLSVRGKFYKDWAVDYQMRLQQIVTNQFEFRFQGGRLGVSGPFVKVNNDSYSLVWSGALNSDIPGIGQITTQRQLIANPGFFTTLSFQPKGSRLSLFALIAPRVWFYADRDAMDTQTLGGNGGVLGQKPELAIQLQPSLNYDVAVSPTWGTTSLRAGMMFDVRKNANDAGLRRWFWPVDIGVAHTFNKHISIYPHIRASGPWDDGLRADLARNGATPAPWWDTISMGLWINGVIF